MTKRVWLLAAGVLCVVLYLPGLFGPFTFDSVTSLVRNQALDFDPTSAQAWLVAVQSSTAGPLGRPLSMLSFAVSHALFGQSALVEKSINLAIHLLTAYALYRWLELLLCRAPALRCGEQRAGNYAFFAALIWLLSPIQVSTVLYAVQRMEQLSALFVVFGLWFYTLRRCQWLERRASAEELSHTLLGLLLLALAALYSKEDGVLLFGLLALVEVLLFQGRYAGCVKRWVVYAGATALLLPALGVLLLAITEPNWLLERYGWRLETPSQRMLTQARVLWHYVGWFFWPDVRHMSLFHDDIPLSQGWLQPWTTILAVLAWAAVILGSLAALKRSVLPAFCVGFFLVSHGLESTILPLDLVYEHRSYLGNIGLALLLVAAAGRYLPQPAWRPAAALVGLLLSTTLFWRSTLWGDELRLYEAQLRHHPTSERTVYYYANIRMRLADQVHDESVSREHVLAARRYFQYLLSLDPLHFPALVSLLYIDGRWFTGMPDEGWFEQLLQAAEQRRMEPSDANAMDLLVRCILAEYCQVPESRLLELMSTLASRYPDAARYPLFLARYYGETGRNLDRAIDLSQQAVELNPVVAYYQLAGWYVARGERGQAAMALGETLRIDNSMQSLQRAAEGLQ